MTDETPGEEARGAAAVRLEFSFLLVCWMVTMVTLVAALLPV